MEICGRTERQKVVTGKTAGTLRAATDTLTTDMQVSPLRRVQGQCLAVVDGLTGAARWRMMR